MGCPNSCSTVDASLWKVARQAAGYHHMPRPPSYNHALARNVVESAFGALLLMKRRPADLALAAVEDSDDGVAVSLRAVDSGLCVLWARDSLRLEAGSKSLKVSIK